MKKEYPNLLRIISDGNVHSGEVLAAKLGVSRVAIWKSIQSLRNMGLEISAISGKGYCLNTKLELLAGSDINNMLSEKIKRGKESQDL